MELKKYMKKIIVMIMQLDMRVSFSVVGVLIYGRLNRKSGQSVELWDPHSIFKTICLSARRSMLSTVIGTSSTIPALISEALPESLRVTFKSPGIFESTVAIPNSQGWISRTRRHFVLKFHE
jgi:hypothetical protein